VRAARDFARHVQQQWHLGQCDDDMVIVLSDNEKQMWTELGATTAWHLDQVINSIRQCYHSKSVNNSIYSQYHSDTNERSTRHGT
jgi:hypothetical protein